MRVRSRKKRFYLYVNALLCLRVEYRLSVSNTLFLTVEVQCMHAQ
jgi:hypothetical protein